MQDTDLLISEQTVEIIDGFRVNVDTGEILGIADEPREFCVESDDTANWVLGKMLDAESRLAAIETSEEVIRAKAILANAEDLAKEQRKKLDWLHRRFDNELGEYARWKLSDAKTKTWKTLLGSVSLRVKKGGLRVVDPAKALEWAKRFQPEAVKVVESFQVSLVPDAVKAEMFDVLRKIDCAEAGPETVDELAKGAFFAEPDSETVTVKTGVA